MNETDVYIRLRKAVESWPQPNVREGVLKAVGALEMHRSHRHHFAHWLVRKVKNENVFIMFTMNSGEAKRRGIEKNDPFSATYGIVDIGHLKEEMKKLEENGEYLGRVIMHLEGKMCQT